MEQGYSQAAMEALGCVIRSAIRGGWSYEGQDLTGPNPEIYWLSWNGSDHRCNLGLTPCNSWAVRHFWGYLHHTREICPDGYTIVT